MLDSKGSEACDLKPITLYPLGNIWQWKYLAMYNDSSVYVAVQRFGTLILGKNKMADNTTIWGPLNKEGTPHNSLRTEIWTLIVALESGLVYHIATFSATPFHGPLQLCYIWWVPCLQRVTWIEMEMKQARLPVPFFFKSFHSTIHSDWKKILLINGLIVSLPICLCAI